LAIAGAVALVRLSTMPALPFAADVSWYSWLHAAPLRPLHTFFRTTENRWRPSKVLPYLPAIRRAQEVLLEGGKVAWHQRATVTRESGRGLTPTIVLGGFVPDSDAQVFLLRRFFLQAGALYSLQYSRVGFSLDLICAQLEDLVAELRLSGQRPVVFGVSFGAGIVLEWLRRHKEKGTSVALAGVVLVSPVACVADVLSPAVAKPATLLGRAVQPYLNPLRPPSAAAVERSRLVFKRMFAAGTQNQAALLRLMTGAELKALRTSVEGAVGGITTTGACERMQAMVAMKAPTDYFGPGLLPLSTAPALILFAENEEAVLVSEAPSLFAFKQAHKAYFPNGSVREVRAKAGAQPVQHASLIFHVFEFLPPLQAFYARLRAMPLSLAA